MKYNSYIILCVCFILFGCNFKKKQQISNDGSEGLPVINLTENVEEVPSLPLSEAASKIEFVPLEVTNESIMGGIYKL